MSLEELLYDLEKLNFKDGYCTARFEYCDDEIVAESCLNQYKGLADKYNIQMKTVENLNYDDFEYDYEFAEAIWFLQETLSDEIRSVIKNKIKMKLC